MRALIIGLALCGAISLAAAAPGTVADSVEMLHPKLRLVKSGRNSVSRAVVRKEKAQVLPQVRRVEEKNDQNENGGKERVLSRLGVPPIHVKNTFIRKDYDYDDEYDNEDNDIEVNDEDDNDPHSDSDSNSDSDSDSDDDHKPTPTPSRTPTPTPSRTPTPSPYPYFEEYIEEYHP